MPYGKWHSVAVSWSYPLTSIHDDLLWRTAGAGCSDNNRAYE